MKKDFKILVFLTCIFVVIYFSVPNFQSNLSDNATVEASTTNSQQETVKYINTLDEEIILNFDIVRISKHGDAVIAGKSNPNLNIKLLDDNQVLSSLNKIKEEIY